jgi:hypothetical protein
MGDDKDRAADAEPLHDLDNFSFRFYIDGAFGSSKIKMGIFQKRRASAAGAATDNCIPRSPTIVL